ncbi:retrovirus-related pol polyprotein from transposon TNT 1-94 [Tanacetum coccineum]
MNYLEEQTDGEAMINSIKNGEHPLHVVAQVSLAGTTSNVPPPLKDPKFWTAEEKKNRKIDRLARSLLIQGLPNDIYSFIDSNDTAKDLWDALERQMRGSEYGEQDRKAAILYEYETFKAIEGEQLLDTYLLLEQSATRMETQNQGDVNDAMGYKKKAVVATSDPLALVAEKTKVSKRKEKVVVQSESEGSDDEDISDLKKITALLAKAFNRKKYYAKPTNNNLRTSSSANKKPEYGKLEEKKEDKKADEKKRDMSKVKCYNCKKEGHFAKDCKKKTKLSSSSAEETIAEVFYYTSDSEKIYHDAIESTSEKFNENHIVSQKDHDESKVDHNDSEEKGHLVDKLIKKFNQKIAKCQKRIEKANQQSKDLENQNKLLQDKYDVLKNQVNTFEEKNNEFNDQIKLLNEKNGDLLAQAKVLQEQLKVKHVVIDNHTECQAYENAISKSENQSENDCQVVEKGCDNLENSKVIAPGMFKINVSQSVSPISVSKTSCASNNVENKTKRKRRKRTSSKQNDKQVNNDVLRANRDFVHFSDLDTLSSVRRPKHSGVIWKKKGSSNTSNVDLSSVSNSKLNKDVKRYSRKDLLSCNNSHHVDTRSAYACNDAMNVSCNSRLYASYDVNDLFVFDDVSIRNSQVSKMPFRKKPRDSLNVHSKNNLNNSLPRTLVRWFPKMQPLAEPVAKWIPKIVQICLWIIDSGCSKHMTGNRALLTNFVEKFLGTVRFGNNDFAVIAGYGDVVIGSMTIKKVYYVKGLGHKVAFQKSTCFVRNEDGVDLLTGDRSSNLYTIALNEIASNSLACLLAKASSSQSWLWHQRLSHLNFATINNLVKSNLVRGLPKMKFEKDHLCSACEQGKIHRKHHKSKTAFASNKPLYLLHMDLCGPMRVESINGKRYVLVVVDDYSRYTWVFFLHSKDEASEVIISFIKKTQVNLQLQVQRIRTDNGTEFKNKTLAKFFDEVRITQQFSAARTPQQNGFGVSGRGIQTLVDAAHKKLWLHLHTYH